MKIKLLKTVVPFVFLLFFCLQANAQDFTVDGVDYDITSSTTVSATGYDGVNKTPVIPDSVTNSGTTYSVTSIGDDAFSRHQLTSVTIGNSVISIGGDAFYNNRLSSVSIPDSVISIGVFAFATNQLSSVSIPNSVIVIGNYAFYDNRLSSVSIPDSVTSISEGAFATNQLSSVTIPNSVISIGGVAFYGNQITSVSIPNSVISIEQYAFFSNQLTSVTIPNSVISIDGYAFYDNQLTSVTIGSGVTFIGEDAFADNAPLTSVTSLSTTPATLPASAISNRGAIDLTIPVGTSVEYANKDWTGFRSVTEQNLTVVSFSPANNATGVVLSDDLQIVFSKNVAIGTGNITIYDAADDSIAKTIDVTNAANVAITDATVTINPSGDLQYNKNYYVHIDGTAFKDVANNNFGGIADKTTWSFATQTTFTDGDFVYVITSAIAPLTVMLVSYTNTTDKDVTIPTTTINSGNAYAVTSIGTIAFYNNQLTSVIIGSSVTSIGQGAFAFNQLTSVNIPDSVTSIGDFAFKDNLLTSVTIGSGVTSIGEDAFADNAPLTSVTSLSTTPATLPASAISNRGAIDLTIPVGTSVEYANKDWTGFRSVTEQNLTVVSFSPANNATGVVLSDDLQIVFSKNVAIGTGNITIYDAADDSIAKTIDVTDAANVAITDATVTINPYGDLQYNKNYYVHIDGTAFKDVANNNFGGIADKTTWSFATQTRFTDGDFVYVITSAIAPLTVMLVDYTNTINKEVTIPTTTTTNSSNTYAVTSIGDYAFNTKQLTSVTIGNSVTSIGVFAFFGNQLTDVDIPNSVTSIGRFAFAFNQLRSVTIGSGVTSIGDRAFFRNQLTSVTIGSSVTSIGVFAFALNQITSVIIPNSVISIGGFAFTDNALTSVTIPNSVTSIGAIAFYGNQLTSVTIGSGVTSIGDEAFSNNAPLTNVTSLSTTPATLPAGAISNRGSIDLFIPENTVSVYNAAGWTEFGSVTEQDSTDPTVVSFSPANNATGVVVSDDLQIIFSENVAIGTGNITIYDATDDSIVETIDVTDADNVAITDATVTINPSGDLEYNKNYYVQIDGTAFKDVANNNFGGIADKTTWSFATQTTFADGDFVYAITSAIAPLTAVLVDYTNTTNKDVTIPTTTINSGNTYAVTSIGKEAFLNNQLASVTIPDSVTSIGEGAFAYNQLTSVTIGNSVTSIGFAAFAYNQLASVNIPVSVTSIGAIAFFNNQLTSVTIGSSVTSIGVRAFRNNQLTTVNIPDSVTSIGEDAFADNAPLTSVTSISTTPATLPASAIENRGAIDLFIPENTVSVYNAALWTGFRSVTEQNLTVVSFSPANNATGVVVSDDLQIVFSKNVAIGTGNIIIYDAADDSIVETIDVTNAANVAITDATVTINPSGDLEYNKNYYVHIDGTAFKDVANNNFGGIADKTTWSFATQTTFTDGDFVYVITSAIAPLTVMLVDYTNTTNKDVTIPTTTINSGNAYAVTSIGTIAFYNNQLTSVIIGSSVTSIGDYAFADNQLTDVDIPNSVISIGDAAFYSNQLTDVNIPNSVIVIGPFAFASNQLTSVSIPNSVIVIGNYAFYDNRLSSVSIPDSVTSIGDFAFATNQLSSVTIPNSVISIGGYAFFDNRLSSATIGSGVTSIGDVAFSSNAPLTSVTSLSTTPATLPASAIGNRGAIDLFIPENTVSVYSAALWTGFRSVTEQNLTVVSFSPANNATGVVVSDDLQIVFSKNVAIGTGNIIIYDAADDSIVETIDVTDAANVAITDATVTINPSGDLEYNKNYYVHIDGTAFKDVANNNFGGIADKTTWSFATQTTFTDGDFVYVITSAIAPLTVMLVSYTNTTDKDVTIPTTTTINSGTTYSVTSIGESAFMSHQLTSVTIGNSVISIGGVAFYNNRLSSVSIPDSVISIGDFAFATNQLASVTIPDSVTSIGQGAFFDNQLTSVTIPNSVTTIGEFAFYVNQLTSVTIPNSVISIGQYAFYDNQITSVTIGSSVTSIGGDAFSNNAALTSVTSLSTTPPTLPASAIGNRGSIDLFIPENTVSVYNAALWTDFRSVTEQDLTDPTVVSFSPANNATGVVVSDELQIVFSENVAIGTGNITIYNAADDSIAKTIDVTDADNVEIIDAAVFIYPSGDLEYNKNYYVQIDGTAFKDVANNNFGGIADKTTWSFATQTRFTNGDFVYVITSAIAPLTVMLVDYTNTTNKDVTIPTTTTNSSNTYAVTYIGKEAFLNNQLTGISIPDSVTFIGLRAFAFNQLISVNIPDSVTSIGEEAFLDNRLIIVNIPNSVTAIGPRAFKDNLLTSVTIGSSVRFILGMAFFGNQLSSVSIPDSVTFIGPWAFKDNSLTSVTIGSGVTSIGERAFFDNAPLTSVTSLSTTPATLPASAIVNRGSIDLFIPVGTSDEYTNKGWTGFRSVTEQNLTVVSFSPANNATGVVVSDDLQIVFSENVAIGTGNITIYDAADDSVVETIDVTNAANVAITDATVTINPSGDLEYNKNYYVQIDGTAFKDVTNNNFGGIADKTTWSFATQTTFTNGDFVYVITSAIAPLTAVLVDYTNTTNKDVTIPTTTINSGNTYAVTSIGNDAFLANELTSVSIPNSVISIEQFAFAFNQLISVNIPDSVISISEGAFRNNQLTGISIPDSVTSIGFGAFRNNQLTSVNIPDSVTSIGDYAFYDNQITSVIIGSSVTSIGDYAFHLNRITSVNIPNSVISIGQGAFERNLLASVTIGSGVTSIGERAFFDNAPLTNVTSLSTTPATLPASAIGNRGSIDLFIPENTVSVYNAAGWTEFGSVTEQDSTDPTVVSFSPANNATGVVVSDDLQIVFSENVAIGTGNIIIYDAADDSIVETIDVTDADNVAITDATVTINPSGDLEYNKNYYVQIDGTAFKDVANNNFGGIADKTAWSFATQTTFTNGDFVYVITSAIAPLTVMLVDYTNIINKDVTIPTTTINSGNTYAVTSIGEVAFRNNQLTSVSIPNSVISIEQFAFASNQLISVTIGNSVTSIGEGAFAYNQLTGVSIGSSVISIGGYAFYGNQLTSVTIGSGVTSIGLGVFAFNQLTDVTIPNSVTSIGLGAFYVNQLTDVTIPNSVTSIGLGAFYGNQLTSVTIGSSVISIGEGAFQNNQLTTLIIPDSVTSIGDVAFEDNLLTSVTIGSGVTSIGEFAFSNNTPLTSVTSLSTTPATLPASAIGNRGSIDLFIPENTDSDYNAAGWTGFKSPTLSISDTLFEPEAVFIYPNPAKQTVNISLGLQKATVAIFDMNGKMIKNIKNYKSDQAIDISSLQIGVYLIRITDNSTVISKRLLKTE